jgi:hypothetical protein
MTAYPDEWFTDEELEEARAERDRWRGTGDEEEQPS